MKSLFLKEWNAIIRYHLIAGPKKPIVYLAGLNFPSLVNFLPTATHPKIYGHSAVLIDYFGVGNSEHPADFSHSMEDHAKTVASVLDHEGLSDCVIVGHSMGGTVGIYLALQRPDLVSQLFVCEGNIMPGGGGATRMFTSVSEGEFTEKLFPDQLCEWRQYAVDGDEMSGMFCGAWEHADFKGIYRSSHSLVNLPEDFKERFFALPVKTTYVFGEKSLPENPGESTPDTPDPDELIKHGIDVAVVAGAGHGMMFANLDGFVDILSARL